VSERVSVGLPEIVEAFGVFNRFLIEALVAEKLLTVEKAQRIFETASDSLRRSGSKGAAAVVEEMHKQMNWNELSNSPATRRRRGSS
jgi:hypothetical protein